MPDRSLSGAEPAAPSALVLAPGSLCAVTHCCCTILFQDGLSLSFNARCPKVSALSHRKQQRHAPLSRTTLTIGTLPFFLPRIRKRASASIACVTNSAARRLPTILPGFTGILAAISEEPVPFPREKTHAYVHSLKTTLAGLTPASATQCPCSTFLHLTLVGPFIQAFNILTYTPDSVGVCAPPLSPSNKAARAL